jgi:RNA polymerase sigma-70 factor (ECF subfamily)
MGPETFELVVVTHHPEIHRYLRRMTARSAVADDLSQETFLRAYRAYGALPEDANVRAWLFAIATNLFRNHIRSEKRRSTFQAAVLATRSEAGGGSPDGESVYRETRTLIEEVVARLPVKQRTAFVLRKIHELDYETIARTLDCSADSARAHVFQALRKIRQSLNGHELAMTEVVRAAGRPGAGAPASEASEREVAR